MTDRSDYETKVLTELHGIRQGVLALVAIAFGAVAILIGTAAVQTIPIVDRLAIMFCAAVAGWVARSVVEKAGRLS
jgi:hypothetical protein